MFARCKDFTTRDKTMRGAKSNALFLSRSEP